MVAWVNVNLVVLRDHNGQPTRTFAAINDITQAKQAEEDLRKHRRFLADLIENSGTLIFVKDRHGRYEMVNRKYEQVTGLRREQILGRTDEELFPGPIGQQFRQNDLEVMAAGTMLEKEEVLESAQGKRFFIAIKFPVRGDGDEVRGVCGMTTEITERQRAEAEKEKLQAQLLQAQKMESVGRLAGGVAHDFNNMLQAILGNTALALEQVSPNSPIHDDLLEIQKAAQRSAPSCGAEAQTPPNFKNISLGFANPSSRNLVSQNRVHFLERLIWWYLSPFSVSPHFLFEKALCYCTEVL